ncbi:MAG: hypothetical protein IPF73_17450 [Betaproteobacteria bacterium]|nr:hypothetical protein [Betaproteobacteria bacterium]
MLETPRTTCVAVVVRADYAHWAHVGDSRFHLFRQGTMIRTTKDHSSQYLVDQGIIAPTRCPAPGPATRSSAASASSSIP